MKKVILVTCLIGIISTVFISGCVGPSGEPGNVRILGVQTWAEEGTSVPPGEYPGMMVVVYFEPEDTFVNGYPVEGHLNIEVFSETGELLYEGETDVTEGEFNSYVYSQFGGESYYTAYEFIGPVGAMEDCKGDTPAALCREPAQWIDAQLWLRH